MQNQTFWKRRHNNLVQCFLCSHFCTLSDSNQSDISPERALSSNTFKENIRENKQRVFLSQMGKCRVRKNINGNLESLISNKIVSYNIDPVEKKPLYHFLPNTQTFSLGTMGCNFDCAWCQNSSIAHPSSEKNARQGTTIDAQTIINTCKKYQSPSLSFTYNEPTIFYELMYECAQKAQENHIKTIMVSNGYQSPQLLNTLLPLINAANIDLKSFRDSTYQKYCSARLKPVLNTLKLIAKSNTWLEVTTLLIPNINDSKNEIEDIARFIYNDLGEDVPWHISAFSPQRNMLTTSKTPKESLVNAYEIGKNQGLKHIYIGNIGITNFTKCTHCQQSLIMRDTYSTKFIPCIQTNEEKFTQKYTTREMQKIDTCTTFDGICPHCHTKLAGIW